MCCSGVSALPKQSRPPAALLCCRPQHQPEGCGGVWHRPRGALLLLAHMNSAAQLLLIASSCDQQRMMHVVASLFRSPPILPERFPVVHLFFSTAERLWLLGLGGRPLLGVLSRGHGAPLPPLLLPGEHSTYMLLLLQSWRSSAASSCLHARGNPSMVMQQFVIPGLSFHRPPTTNLPTAVCPPYGTPAGDGALPAGHARHGRPLPLRAAAGQPARAAGPAQREAGPGSRLACA